MPGAVSYGAGAVEVEGLLEFQAAMKELEATVAADLKAGLVRAAEPVKGLATRHALESISGMKRLKNSAWEEFRIGQSAGLVYIAPKERGKKKGGQKRPNLAALLIVKAMEPAAEDARPVVEASVEVTLREAFARAGV